MRRLLRPRPNTERVKFSQVLRQTPSAAEPNKISIVERYITEVDAVPDRFHDVEVLFLSQNSITAFSGFVQVCFRAPCYQIGICATTKFDVRAIKNVGGTTFLHLQELLPTKPSEWTFR